MTAIYSGVTGSQHLIVVAQTYRLVGVISDDSTDGRIPEPLVHDLTLLPRLAPPVKGHKCHPCVWNTVRCYRGTREKMINLEPR